MADCPCLLRSVPVLVMKISGSQRSFSSGQTGTVVIHPGKKGDLTFSCVSFLPLCVLYFSLAPMSPSSHSPVPKEHHTIPQTPVHKNLAQHK